MNKELITGEVISEQSPQGGEGVSDAGSWGKGVLAEKRAGRNPEPGTRLHNQGEPDTSVAERPEEGQGAEGQIRHNGGTASKHGACCREGLAFRRGAMHTKKALGRRAERSDMGFGFCVEEKGHGRKGRKRDQ